jgi:hypothetical protein
LELEEQTSPASPAVISHQVLIQEIHPTGGGGWISLPGGMVDHGGFARRSYVDQENCNIQPHHKEMMVVWIKCAATFKWRRRRWIGGLRQCCIYLQQKEELVEMGQQIQLQDLQ